MCGINFMVIGSLVYNISCVQVENLTYCGTKGNMIYSTKVLAIILCSTNKDYNVIML